MTDSNEYTVIGDDDGNDNISPGCIARMKDPRSLFHRLVVLVLMCFLGFGK